MHVRPGDERAGIGTQLVRRVEADFLRSGHSIEILVNATRNAEEFYAAIGYERCVEHPAPSTLFVVMKRLITAARNRVNSSITRHAQNSI